jgi:hypothetical protein
MQDKVELAKQSNLTRTRKSSHKGTVLGPYRKPRYREPDPFRCAHCGSNALLAFSTIYGNGSSISRYRQGLFIKTGWAETKKQTFLAQHCAPPTRHRFVWRGMITAVGLALMYPWPFLLGTAQEANILEAGGICAVIGVLLMVTAIVYNKWIFPKKRERYSESYHCRRCGTVSYIHLES